MSAWSTSEIYQFTVRNDVVSHSADSGVGSFTDYNGFYLLQVFGVTFKADSLSALHLPGTGRPFTNLSMLNEQDLFPSHVLCFDGVSPAEVSPKAKIVLAPTTTSSNRRSSGRNLGVHELSACELLTVDLVRHEDSWPFKKLVSRTQVVIRSHLYPSVTGS